MSEQNNNAETDRRKFIKAAGKLALLAPPAMTFLLSTSMSSDAIASSGGQPHSSGRSNSHSKPKRGRRRGHRGRR